MGNMLIPVLAVLLSLSASVRALKSTHRRLALSEGVFDIPHRSSLRRRLAFDINALVYPKEDLVTIDSKNITVTNKWELEKERGTKEGDRRYNLHGGSRITSGATCQVLTKDTDFATVATYFLKNTKTCRLPTNQLETY